MNKNFLLHEPKFSKKELMYITKAVNTSWVSTSGKMVSTLEKKISNYVGSKCVLLNSGTSALHLSLILSNIKEGEEILVPSITFIATINVVLYMRAKPIFFDCQKNSPNINIEDIINFISKHTFTNKYGTYNKKTYNKISAIIITHVLGDLVELHELKKILKYKKIKLIEDAAEALGTFSKDQKHCGTQGDYGVISFNANKIITTAAGGAILVKKKKDYKLAKLIIAQSKKNDVFFIHNELGYNYGLTSIHAGLGLGQFNLLKDIINKKKNIHLEYQKCFFKEKNFSISDFNKNSKPNFWLNSIILKTTSSKIISSIVKELISSGIQVRPIWYPNHKQIFLKKYQNYNLQNANKIYKKIICIPSSYFLTKKEINFISKKIKKIINEKIK